MVNAYAKFDQIRTIHLQDIEWKTVLRIKKGHNYVANLLKRVTIPTYIWLRSMHMENSIKFDWFVHKMFRGNETVDNQGS